MRTPTIKRLEPIKAAEEEYTSLLRVLHGLTHPNHPLMGNTDKASKYRSLLLGRTSEQNTSWIELWQGRLRFDVQHSNINVAVDSGVVTTEAYVPSPLVECEDEPGKFEIPIDLMATVTVLLQGYSREDRQHFYDSNLIIRERSIAFLFGLRQEKGKNRAATIKGRMKELNYKKLREMLDKCVELARAKERVSRDRRKVGAKQTKRRKKVVMVGGKVTEEIANRVYNWTNNPLGKKLPIVDTSLYDEQTIENMEEYFAERYLDGAILPSSKKYNNLNIQAHPKLTVGRYSCIEGRNSFRVLAIDNILSKEAVEEILNLLNKEKFVQGVGGNKCKTYICVSSLSSSPFVVSDGRVIYGSVEFTDLDYMLKGYFEKLMGIQTSTVEKEIEGDFKQTVGCNMLHIVVGHFKNAKYVYHSDFGCYLCTDDTVDNERIYSGNGRVHLPTRAEQQTYTIAITMGTKEPNATLSHRDATTKKSLGALQLGNTCAHIQFAHSQEAWVQQGVEKVNDKDVIKSPGAIRIIITARCSIPTDHVLYKQQYVKTVGSEEKFNRKFWQMNYIHSNVINALRNIDAVDTTSVILGKGHVVAGSLSNTTVATKDLPTKELPDEDKVTEEKEWINLCNEENSDRYKKIPKEWFDDLLITRPVSRGSLKQPLSYCLYDNRFVYTLFREGILVDVPAESTSPGGKTHNKWRSLIPRIPRSKGMDEHITVDVQETDMEFLIPGKICSIDWVSQLLNLEVSERRWQPYNQTTTHIRGILCSQAYKNRMDMVIEELKHIIMRSNLRDKGLLPPRNNKGYIPICNPKFGGEQTCYGFGGSPTVQGSNAPTPSNDSKTDAGIVFSIGQGLCVPDHRDAEGDNTRTSTLLDDNVAFFKQYQQQSCVFLYFWDEMQLLGGEKNFKHLVDPRIYATENAKKSCHFVNYMVIKCWIMEQPLDHDVVEKQYTGYSKKVTQFLEFRCNKHNEIVFCPFFSDEDYALMEMRQESNFIYMQLLLSFPFQLSPPF